MPTIDISLKDFQDLLKKKISLEELEEAVLYVKGEIDGHEDDNVKIDCKETNRPDLWSTEGMVRQIAPFYNKNLKGVPRYEVKKSKFEIIVPKKIKVRPYIVAAIIKDLKIDDELIRQMIQLQEKVCNGFGRKRKEAALGIYDLDKIKFPLYYKAVKPEGIKFVPLGYRIEMTPQEILEEHPKGKEFAKLLAGAKEYPLVIDSDHKVASLPPVINSNHTGRVTEDTKNLFIEVTGLNLETIKIVLNVAVAALADRGGKIEAVKVNYPDMRVTTPDFTPKKIIVDKDYINRISGLNLKDNKIKELLEKSGYDVSETKDKLKLEYPSYRPDIMHPIDVVEDLIIAYGYNNIEPEKPKLATDGDLNEFEVFCEKVRNHVVGMGAIELLNFTLTNKDTLFTKMGLEEQKVIEIANPVSEKWSVIRDWIIPSLLDFLGQNNTAEYPQQVYEVGDAVLIDESAETGSKSIKRLAWALADKNATFTNAKQALEFVLDGLDLEYKFEEVEHSSFIRGRTARVSVNGVKVAYVGEIHPKVISNFGIKMPTVAFELNLTDLYGILKK